MSEEVTEESFPVQVRALVRRIPEGRLASYGQIAKALGRPRAARIVGGVMSSLGAEGRDVPWHRVVNKQGGISPRSDMFSDRDPTVEQAELLLSEGLEPGGDGAYDMGEYGMTLSELQRLARRTTGPDTLEG